MERESDRSYLVGWFCTEVTPVGAFRVLTSGQNLVTKKLGIEFNMYRLQLDSPIEFEQ